MNKKKKIITIICVIAVIAVVVCVFTLTRKNTQNEGSVQETQAIGELQKTEEAPASPEAEEVQSQDKEENKGETDKKEEKVYTPTFMYFVSGSDEGFENTNKIIEELKKEYKGKVNFDVRNIDEDKDAGKNFSAEGNTPLLIMLNTKNDISAFNPKCSDKDTLKQAIEIALGAE